jgi:hypothetical protein
VTVGFKIEWGTSGMGPAAPLNDSLKMNTPIRSATCCTRPRIPKELPNKYVELLLVQIIAPRCTNYG